LFWINAALLECLQDFSPGRHPSFADFSASGLGASFGGLAAALFACCCLWNCAYPDVT
jgi:VanZ family protein